MTTATTKKVISHINYGTGNLYSEFDEFETVSFNSVQIYEFSLSIKHIHKDERKTINVKTYYYRNFFTSYYCCEPIFGILHTRYETSCIGIKQKLKMKSIKTFGLFYKCTKYFKDETPKRYRYKYTNYVGIQKCFRLSPLSKNITFRELTRWDVTVTAS